MACLSDRGFGSRRLQYQAYQGEDAISARLAEPSLSVALPQMAERWFHAHVDVLCRIPGNWLAADLLRDPALPGRLRGAWGRQLLLSASDQARKGMPCPWSPPCAYDPLFRERPALKGLEIPKPFVISVNPAPAPVCGEGVVLRLTLFGFATDWLETAADAWVMALRGGVGMPDGLYGALDPVDRRISVHDSLPMSSVPPAAILRFATPLCLRRGGAVHGEMTSLFTSLGNRLSGMARWLDTRIEADWRSLKEHVGNLTIDASRLRPLAWHRHSARQGDTAIRMEGLIGTVAVTGDLAPVWPILTLGALTHAGSHAAIGLGRFTLDPVTL